MKEEKEKTIRGSKMSGKKARNKKPSSAEIKANREANRKRK